MTDSAASQQEAPLDTRLALLLAMAMFVLVVDTSLMNVSISAVVQDLGTTVSGVQSAIALEALVSAAFILIGSKVGDLIGRKRAYVLGCGLRGRRAGDDPGPGPDRDHHLLGRRRRIGASLLLPAMQSLIHGNFQGAAQKRVYAMVGRVRPRSPRPSGRCSAASSPRSCRGGSRSRLEVVVIAVVLSGHQARPRRPVHRVRVRSTWSARCCPSWAWAASCSASWSGRRAARRRRAPWSSARSPWPASSTGCGGASAQAKATLLDPDLFKSKLFRPGVSGQLLQQIALGGTMIVLPIYLQMVLEYNALQAGLSLAPLSLTHVRASRCCREEGRQAAAGRHHPRRLRAADRLAWSC